MPKDECDPEDPMEFVAMSVPADAGTDARMAECFVEEFGQMGFDRERLLGMFANPLYAGTNRLYVTYGEAWVKDAIDRVLSRWTFVRT